MDLAELHKIEEDYENMFRITLTAHIYAYNRGIIARIFCNYGYYFTEKEDYDTAVNMYIVSDSYLTTKTAANEINYISEKTGKEKFTCPSREEMQKICQKAGVYYGLNIAVPELMKAVAAKAKEDNDEELEQKALNALFELTSDKNVYNLMRQVRKDGKEEMKAFKERQKAEKERKGADGNQ